MKIANTRFKKTVIIVISLIITVMVVVIMLISPIVKYMVEKYDEKYTGRQIELGWVYVNPFTGYVHFSNLRIFESRNLPGLINGDSVFFTARGVSVNFAMLKLLSKTIEITEITLDRPNGIVIQNRKDFNFNDLIKKFTPQKSGATPSGVHFNILNIKVIDGEFHYMEKQTPIKYYIKKVNLQSAGKKWNADTIAAHLSLIPGAGSGDMKGDFTINFKTNEYGFAVVVRKFDLNIIQQYLKDLTNDGTFTANLDADMKARGNFSDQEDMTASGMIAINDFHFGKNPKEDYVSFDKLLLAITEVSPKNHKYVFDSVSLSHPFLKYERYDYLDNLQRMIGRNGANIASAASDPAKFNLVIEIARYIKVLAKNFFHSDYKINRLAIYKGDLQYNDFAITEKFSVGLNPLYFFADSINRNNKRVEASLTSGILPYGHATVKVSINPKDSSDFDLQYYIQQVPVTMFNPYLINYTSYPVDRGTLEINGNWVVRNGIINSTNHLVMIDPRAIRRLKNKGTNWIPLRWIMSLIRERGNVIDYEIPITGNLRDPKFHLHDVLMDLLENIFVKPATASYRMEVKNVETEIEKSLTLKWGMRRSLLLPDQEKFVEKMATFLAETPEASITVYPQQYAFKEQEYILFFEAKKKYFLLANHKNARSFSEADSEVVDKMAVRDSLFNRYLNKQVTDTTIYTLQEKCNVLVGSALIDARFKRLNYERERAFILPFKENGIENRVKINAGENTVPYNGFSFYKIVYQGELPESLIKAHRKMNDFNNEPPRKKYQKLRGKTR